MEEKNKNKVEISVCGSTVTLLTDEDENYVAELGQRLDKKVRDLTLSHRTCTKTEALILCAIEALDAAIKLKSKLDSVKGNDKNE